MRLFSQNRSKIPLGRFWKLPKFFFGPGGSPRALRKRFLDSRSGLLRALGFHVVFVSIFGSKNGAQEAPGTLKIKVFVWIVCKISGFRIFNTDRQKKGQNEPQGLPKWSPKRSPGPPGRVKSRWEISPEAPRKITMNFFSAPGASGSVLGASRGGSWSPVGAQEGPRGFQEPFWHHLGSQNGAPRPHFWSFLRHLGALPWLLSPFALSGLASMLVLALPRLLPSIPGSRGRRVPALALTIA